MTRDGHRQVNKTIQQIVREAHEHDDYVVAHPDEFTRQQVDAAKLNIFQRERLQVRDILRYGD